MLPHKFRNFYSRPFLNVRKNFKTHFVVLFYFPAGLRRVCAVPVSGILACFVWCTFFAVNFGRISVNFLEKRVALGSFLEGKWTELFRRQHVPFMYYRESATRRSALRQGAFLEEQFWRGARSVAVFTNPSTVHVVFESTS